MPKKEHVDRGRPSFNEEGILKPMAPIDLTKVLKKTHEGKWVALSRDYRKVIDSNVDLIVLKASMDAINADVAYMKVPTAEFAYANY